VQKVRGKPWQSDFDLIKAFYQRYVKKKDRWKLAVITHRGQEIFNVTPMGYCGSPSHMQKFMDKVISHPVYRLFGLSGGSAVAILRKLSRLGKMAFWR
jgi:hypothetical protein